MKTIKIKNILDSQSLVSHPNSNLRNCFFKYGTMEGEKSVIYNELIMAEAQMIKDLFLTSVRGAKYKRAMGEICSECLTGELTILQNSWLYNGSFHRQCMYGPGSQ